MPQEPDWKTIAQASMQQRDEANRNLCNLQIELAVMAERLKKFETETGEPVEDVPANSVIKGKVAKPTTETSH